MTKQQIALTDIDETVYSSTKLCTKKDVIIDTLPLAIATVAGLVFLSTFLWIALSLIGVAIINSSFMFLYTIRQNTAIKVTACKDKLSDRNQGSGYLGKGFMARQQAANAVEDKKEISRGALAKAILFNHTLRLTLKTVSLDSFGSEKLDVVDINRQGITHKKIERGSEFAVWGKAVSNAKKLR